MDKQRSIKDEFEDNKGTIIISISNKNRQHNGQKKKVQMDKQRSIKYEFEDTKVVIRISISKKNRQHSD